MAELVSVRTMEGENSNDKMSTVQIAIENPAYSNDTENSYDEFTSATNGLVKSDSIPATALEGTTISFHNVTYTVELKIKRKKVNKEIVKGIRYVANVNTQRELRHYNYIIIKYESMPSEYYFIAIILRSALIETNQCKM